MCDVCHPNLEIIHYPNRFFDAILVQLCHIYFRPSQYTDAGDFLVTAFIFYLFSIYLQFIPIFLNYQVYV